MTDQTKALLPVTPEDRHEAWPFVPRNSIAGQDKQGFFAGKYDNCQAVQAFARHRQSHSLPGDVEAAAAWLFDNRWSVPHPMGCRWQEAPSSTQEAWLAYAKGVAAALTPSALSGDAGGGELRAALAKRTSMITVINRHKGPQVEIQFASLADAHALFDAILKFLRGQSAAHQGAGEP